MKAARKMLRCRRLLYNNMQRIRPPLPSAVRSKADGLADALPNGTCCT